MTFAQGEIPQASKFNDLATKENLTQAVIDAADQLNGYTQSAQSSADISSQNAQVCENAVAAAQSAAETSQNIADANTYYITPGDPNGTIAGIAGTPVGKLFRVAIQDGDGQTVIFNYYKNESGSASFINSEASKRYLDMVVGDINALVGFTTLATLTDLTGQNYILKSDGTLVSSSDWRNSTYIPVKAGRKINLTASNSSPSVANIAFYDINHVFISADNVGVGSSAYQRTFIVPADGFVILSTRIATSTTFVCDLFNDVMTTGIKDKPGGYISQETFVDTVGPISSGSGSYAFTNSGYVSVSTPTEYPTSSTTAFSSSFIPVLKGDKVRSRVALSSEGYAIAFFLSTSATSFAEGVVGTGNGAISEYVYHVAQDGYVVISTASTVLATAVKESSYVTEPEIVKRGMVDASIVGAIPSTDNLVQNGMADVYYSDTDAKISATITDNNYVSIAGGLVSDSSRRLYAISLQAGDSIYAKVNIGSSTATTERGVPVLSRFISAGVFEPLTFCFISGNAYTEHKYTAVDACTIYVTALKVAGSFPPIIQKRKYAIGDKTKQFPYLASVFEGGALHSISNLGRLDANVAYMTTPLIPVKKGDIVKAKTAQNSGSVGSSLNMGVKYNAVGKFLTGTLTFTYASNSQYGYAVTVITEDGFIAVNHYVSGGISAPEVTVFSKNDALTYAVKAPASNPYGDIYPGKGYDSSGALIAVPSAVTYLFDRAMTPMDATITLSFMAGTTYKYLAKFDSNRALIGVTTLTSGIASFQLKDLFDSAGVIFVGITHSSDGVRDSTSVNLSVESRRGGGSFFELSEPVYNLYELAGRPDKTLSYDYTPLLQKLCFQMERQKRGKVYFESGLYKVSGCYVKSYNHFYGDGMDNTIISGADTPFKNEKLSNKVYEKITFENLGFNLDLLSQRAGRAINMEYVKDLVVRNIWINKSFITGFGVDMIMSGVLDNIVTEGCGQAQGDGSCAGMGIGVGAFLAGSEPIQVINCINRNNYGHGIFFEWHNHTESSGETIIGDFPVGIQVINCYSEGNAVGFGNAGGNGVSFVNCTAYRNLNGFAADNGSEVNGIRYGKNAVFSDCKAIENGTAYNHNPYFTTRQMAYGNGHGFAIFKTADYSNAQIGDNSRGYYLTGCISENNESYGLRISAASNVNTPVRDVQVNGGTFSRNGGSGIQVSAATENLLIRGCLNVNNVDNGIGIAAQVTDAIVKDNIIKGNAKGITAGSAMFVDTTIVKDNIVKGNTLDLENVTNS